jgi:2,3-bisphosphoglycerate-dependent phosphoglycerate mutase
MILYLARHGQSEANVLRVFSNGLNKHSLTELGRTQAELLAHRMANCSIKRIFASPILRAVQTAEIVSLRLRIGFQVEPALSEFSVGTWEGRTDEAGWEAHKRLFEKWMTEKDFLASIGGGENYLDVKNRYLPFIMSLVSVEALDVDTLLIGHGGTTLAMLPCLTSDIQPEELLKFKYPNTAVIKLEWSGKTFRFLSME